MTRATAISKVIPLVVLLGLSEGAAWALTSRNGAPAPQAAPAAGPRDERAAVEAFLAESLLVRSARATAEVARAGLVGAGVWPNPQVQADREQVFSQTGREDENRLGLQMPFPWGDKLALARKVSAAAASTAQAWAESQIQEYVADFRAAAARAHFAKARRDALQSAVEAYSRVLKVVEARVAAGEEASYDSKRVRLARAALSARLAAQAVKELETLSVLGAMLGRPILAPVQLADPGVDLPGASNLAFLQASHPALWALREERRRSDAARELAGRRAWPDPVLALGFKQASAGLGYVAGVGWPLPVSDRGQNEIATAAAEAARWEADEEATARKLEGELAGALEALRGRQEVAAAYARESGGLAPDLVRMAETAYREGQGTVLGVLDAHEAVLGARLEYVGLLEEAQLARLRVEQLLGKPFALSDWRRP